MQCYCIENTLSDDTRWEIKSFFLKEDGEKNLNLSACTYSIIEKSAFLNFENTEMLFF